MRTCQQQPITRQHKAASDKPCVSHYPTTTEEHKLVQKPLCPFPEVSTAGPLTVICICNSYLGISISTRYQSQNSKESKGLDCRRRRTPSEARKNF
jgi:hypothetical protein